jgi:hypothetical protein
MSISYPSDLADGTEIYNMMQNMNFKLLKPSLSYKKLIHKKECESQISLTYSSYNKLVHDIEYEFQIYQNLLVIQTFLQNMNFIISEIQLILQDLANDNKYRFQIPQICLMVQKT